ncbi:hypothetical protein [Bacillus velezensis]|uniref:hypothetical protein n=1 Tax=Bacillus velezensis TaxID=492670 RepID=UPI001E433C8F|nr:hypothetical protein [Bacillus velezensis]
MTQNNAKIHVLADETLGGIKREYVEVDRKAEVGEKIVIVAKHGIEEGYKNGDIFTVDRDYHSEEDYVESDAAASDMNCSGLIYHEEYRVLEPTDIVHIGTQRYELTDRKAEVGEKVVVVDDEDSSEEFGSFRIGEVGTVESYSSDDMHYGIYANVRVSDERDIPLYSPEYRVLVPVEAAEDEPKPADPIDVIASLAQEVAELKKAAVHSKGQTRALADIQETEAKDLRKKIAKLQDEIDTLFKDKRTLGEELARLKEPTKTAECAPIDAPLVFIERKIGDAFDVYQDGKKLRGIRHIRIDAAEGEFTTHDIEFVSGATEEERP